MSKNFAKGVSFDASFEYYAHSGAFKLGGGGEGSYADFDSYLINAGFRVDLSSLSGHGSTTHHAKHAAQPHIGSAPAGVMFDHMLHEAGDMMIGYRYMYGTQSGDMLHNTSPVADSLIANNACGDAVCSLKPGYMNMHMHMLDIMYAASDWLTLMLMPQFVDMNMSLQGLQSDNEDVLHKHATGGVGDIGAYALVKLFQEPGHSLHTALGITAPSGQSDIKLNPGGHQHAANPGAAPDLGGYIHYGMQLGSGTWDFKPSLTYNGQYQQWSWGAQSNGTVRMQSQNPSGYSLGNIFQTSAWGGYQVLDWLTTTVRGVYTAQSAINGGFNGTHPTDGTVDYAGNYGGRYWDVGFGLTAAMPEGEWSGNRLGFEWLQPVSDNVNGYQLQRQGALSATWSYTF